MHVYNFREPWASIIYHDNFTNFAGALRDNLLLDKGMFCLLDKVLEVSQTCTDDGILSLERRKIIGNRGEHALDTTKLTIESHTLEFLRKNKQSFSHLFIPPVGGIQ